MRKYLSILLVACVALTGMAVVTAAQSDVECPSGNADLVIAAGAVGDELELLKSSLAAYEELCPNVNATALETPDLATDRLGLYIQFLGARSSAVDVYSVDVIWPAIVAEHMVDLYEYFPADSETVSQHVPALIENNTVEDRLIAMPWYVDTGLLYYRTDLLEKYGFDAPPTTWDELESQALTIMEGERAEGNSSFQGYVWQGALGEATTVNGLEWQASEGGGIIVTGDGEVQVNNDETIDAVERAAGWVGSISPAEVIAHGVEDSRSIWQSGNSAFMRNWSYAYSLGNSDNSPIQGLFDLAPLPSGQDRVAATLGGWNLAVSQYSANPEAAVSLVQFLTSAEQQKFRALEQGFNPTVLSVYEDPDIQDASPQFGQLFETLESGSAVARPSTVAGDRYNDVSRLYANAVHSVLTGENDARIALDDLEFELEDLVIELGY
ncbi:MAG: ABC transporter substrate-binding protein [Chloroflexota bacterium]